MNSVMNPVTTYPGLSPAQASLGTSFAMGGSLGAMSRGYGATHAANMAAAAAAQSRPSFAIQELLGLSTSATGGFPGMSPAAAAQHPHHPHHPHHQSFPGHNPLFSPQDHTSPVGGHNPPTAASHYGYQNTFTTPGGVHHPHHPHHSTAGQVPGAMQGAGMPQGAESPPEFGGYGAGSWRAGLLPGLGRDDTLGGLGGRGLSIDTSPSPEKTVLGFQHSGTTLLHISTKTIPITYAFIYLYIVYI